MPWQDILLIFHNSKESAQSQYLWKICQIAYFSASLADISGWPIALYSHGYAIDNSDLLFIKLCSNIVFSCIGEICKKSEEIVKDVLKTCGVPFFLDILNSHNEETVNASSYVIQVRSIWTVGSNFK